jgi:O-acetyl-ADP-ribose deacetylase (regulator of RNase III)
VIEVVVGDLAFVRADAVVRAADELLEPVTPAMAALDRHAGAAFAALRRLSSPLAPGAAVVTGGGDLAAPLVLHVVIQDRAGEGGRDVIRRALVSAWQRAADWGLASIAAPLIGAGVGQLAPEAAAELLVETFPPFGLTPSRLSIVVDREDERVLVAAVVERKRG